MPKKRNKDLRSPTTARTNNYRGVPRRITVKGVQRTPVDLRKLSRALIQLAQAQAEADAQAQAEVRADGSREAQGGTP